MGWFVLVLVWILGLLLGGRVGLAAGACLSAEDVEHLIADGIAPSMAERIRQETRWEGCAPEESAHGSSRAGAHEGVLMMFQARRGEKDQPAAGGRSPRRMTWATGTPRGYAEMIREIAARYGVDAALVKAVIRAESAFDPRAISPKGALGLMQLMPETAALHGVSDAFVPAQNVEGGVRHLRMLLDRYRGDVKLALAAYNAGSQAVEAAGRRVPPYRETQQYVRRVLSYRRAYLRENPPLALRRRR